MRHNGDNAGCWDAGTLQWMAREVAGKDVVGVSMFPFSLSSLGPGN